jgi:hypothetical protein
MPCNVRSKFERRAMIDASPVRRLQRAEQRIGIVADGLAGEMPAGPFGKPVADRHKAKTFGFHARQEARLRVLANDKCLLQILPSTDVNAPIEPVRQSLCKTVPAGQIPSKARPSCMAGMLPPPVPFGGQAR